MDLMKKSQPTTGLLCEMFTICMGIRLLMWVEIY